jgi:hypothetical protein
MHPSPLSFAPIKIFLFSLDNVMATCYIIGRWRGNRAPPKKEKKNGNQTGREHAVYGDNWAGWIPANVAISSPGDTWGKNEIIGGSWCEPANGWMEL